MAWRGGGLNVYVYLSGLDLIEIIKIKLYNG